MSILPCPPSASVQVCADEQDNNSHVEYHNNLKKEKKKYVKMDRSKVTAIKNVAQ